MSTLYAQSSCPAAGFLSAPETVSPLMLSDKLLSMAQEAERAGYPRPAEQLLRLAYAICNQRPH
jgi:hypothetical protein